MNHTFILLKHDVKILNLVLYLVNEPLTLLSITTWAGIECTSSTQSLRIGQQPRHESCRESLGYLEVRNKKENHNKQAESNTGAYFCVGLQWQTRPLILISEYAFSWPACTCTPPEPGVEPKPLEPGGHTGQAHCSEWPTPLHHQGRLWCPIT